MNKHRHDSRRVEADARLRGLRLAELFREELNLILDAEVGDGRLEGTRVTFVELTRDGSRARIWFALRGPVEPEHVNQSRTALERAATFLRMRLSEALPLKRTPELRFQWDPVSEAVRIQTDELYDVD